MASIKVTFYYIFDIIDQQHMNNAYVSYAALQIAKIAIDRVIL
jgi:hypothetical protein